MFPSRTVVTSILCIYLFQDLFVTIVFPTGSVSRKRQPEASLSVARTFSFHFKTIYSLARICFDEFDSYSLNVRYQMSKEDILYNPGDNKELC